MKSKLRWPSPALIISVIALVAALGGTAYAVKKIGTKQIKKGAVTKPKLHKNSVATPKVVNGAITDAKLSPSVRGKAVAYATVAANGTVNADKSRGITSSMVGKTSPTSPTFCFHDLPDGAEVAVATGLWDGSTEFEGPALPIVAKAPLPDIDCSTIPGTQFAVITYSPAGAGGYADRAFVIAFFR